MSSWRYSVGSLVRRAPRAPVAVSPALEDSDLPLANLATEPDIQAGLQWRADGAYAIDLDLNLLEASSSRADAPTGWSDLLLLLAGTPGLPANPPAWGNFGGRNPALKLYSPVCQDVDVMPGESVQLEFGVYLPAASAATGARVRVIDLSTGQGWVVDSGGGWAEAGIVAEQAATNAWLDVSVTIEAATSRTQLARYRVILEPVAAAYDATTYIYASADGAAGSPALFAEVDAVAIVGHSLPKDATVELQPRPSGTPITLPPSGLPSCYTVALTPVLVQAWRLAITMPSGIQPRPVLGELWIGKARTMLVGAPVLPIGVEETSPGQVRVESGRGRVEVMGEDQPAPTAKFDLSFRAKTSAACNQIRDEIARLTRFGADPVLLLPTSEVDGAGRCVHGRIEAKFSYTWESPGDEGEERLFGFALPFAESPFASS